MSTTKNVLIALSVSLFFIGFFSGCSSKNINIIGEKRVEIIKHKAIQEGTFLKIMADLENTDNDETEGFVYQIEWIDKNGLIKDTTPWRAVTIHKNQKVQIVEMTNMPNIVDYNIIVSIPNK